jgi:hypothetical protein
VTTSTIQAGLSLLALLPTQTRLNLARLHVSMLVLLWLALNFQRTLFTPSVGADFNRFELIFLFVSKQPML